LRAISLNVGSGGEGAFRAGNDHRSDRLVLVEGAQSIEQFVGKLGVERIEVLRPVEVHQADAAGRLHLDCLVAIGLSRVVSVCHDDWTPNASSPG
jgi:hypothetical protein